MLGERPNAMKIFDPGETGPADPAYFHWPVSLSDEVNPIAVLAPAVSFRAPTGGYFILIQGSLVTASSSGSVTYDVKINGVSIFTSLPTFTSGVTTDAAGAGVINPAARTFAQGDVITAEITGAGTGAVGLKFWATGLEA